MGTRSRIGVMHGDKCKSVYCHWDGYLDHNGRLLLDHYDSAKANHLVALGDISSLRSKIGEAHPFSKFDLDKEDPEYNTKVALLEQAEREDWTTFYGRDRKEDGIEFEVDQTFEDFFLRAEKCGAEFYYIMKDGVWYCGDTYESSKMFKKLVPLAVALAEQDIEQGEQSYMSADLSDMPVIADKIADAAGLQ